MKSIAFFGASITQQKTGFVHHFAKLNTDYKILQFGYGGMYIHDAGICYIDEVLSHRPNFCFLDWFSPAYYLPHQDIEQYLNVILYKLLQINCHPIFLFFYRDKLDDIWISMFQYLKKYADNHNINYIDLSHLDQPDQYLKDSIHTNDVGSMYYGNLIHTKFHHMDFSKKPIAPPTNALEFIKTISVDIEAYHHVYLKSENCSKIIGILQKIGPYTEDVECVNNNVKTVLSLKDRWSIRYERDSIKSGLDSFCGKLEIYIPSQSKILWKKIFYTGDAIAVIDYE